MASPNWPNRTLFHGDNLKFMRAMNSESVDLIATDPPFNKGRDFHATPDSLAAGARFQDRWSWERDVHQEWVDQITDDWPKLMEAIESARYAHSDGMGAFMCFMAVRLLAMHRILKPTGSIYLHCDPTASHYLKAVMDAIFGWQKFQTEITWKRTYAHGDRVFSSVSDTILFYGYPAEVKDDIRVPLSEKYIAKHFRHTDKRGRYQAITLNGPKISAGESGKPWKGVDPSLSGRCWSPPRSGRYAQWIEEEIIPGYRDIESVHDRLNVLYEAGLIYWPGEPDGIPRLKRYLREGDGQLPSNIWADINPVAHQSKERQGYPTQKPLELYGRMIKASSDRGGGSA